MNINTLFRDTYCVSIVLIGVELGKFLSRNISIVESRMEEKENTSTVTITKFINIY